MNILITHKNNIFFKTILKIVLSKTFRKNKLKENLRVNKINWNSFDIDESIYCFWKQYMYHKINWMNLKSWTDGMNLLVDV